MDYQLPSKITIDLINNGNSFNIYYHTADGNINAKTLGIIIDSLQKHRQNLVPEINKDFYDKEYFEGIGEKSGLDDYDRRSKEYAEEHAKERIEKLIKMVGGDKSWKILEIGCAFGHTVDVLRKMGYSAYGCDISEYAINKYKTDYKEQWDIANDPLPIKISVEYDFIYGFNLMEHIPEVDLKEFIKRMGILLNNNRGILFLTIDNEWGIDMSHQVIRPREWWNKVFRDEGFEILVAETKEFEKINGYVFKKI